MLAADRRRDDCVGVVDDLLKCSDRHGRAAQVVHLRALLLIALFLWLQPLLVADELLLHQQVVLDTLHLEQLQAATRMWRHLRQLRGRLRSLNLLALLANSRRNRRLILLLTVLVVLLVASGPPSSTPRLVLTLPTKKDQEVVIHNWFVSCDPSRTKPAFVRVT